MQNELLKELENIKKIKEGALLKEFSEVTDLMAIAAVRYHKNGWQEIVDGMWTYRLARLCVAQNFIAIYHIPENMKQVCAADFARHGDRITRYNLQSYINVVNEQSISFLKLCIKANPAFSRFISQENMNESIRDSAEARMMNGKKKKKTIITPRIESLNDYDFTQDADLSSPDEDSPSGFIAAPVEKQTKERLYALLDTDVLFPTDFILQIMVPFRNAAYYKEKGDEKLATSWEEKEIKYLNKDVCLYIAATHPEASFQTPKYLDKESVKRFWKKTRTKIGPNEMAHYFLIIPEELLTEDMANDIIISWKVLAHCKNLLPNTEIARKFLNTNPAEVLRLPEEYQTRNRLLANGVPISKGTVPLIKNVDMREIIKEAFGII